MRMRYMIGVCSATCAISASAMAATSLSVSHDTSAYAFDGQLSTTDLAHGLIATELIANGTYPALEYNNGIGTPVEDKGWHPANPAVGDSLHPNGLPTFTDGAGQQAFDGLDGLLNDFPGDGVPTKRLVFDLGGTFDIGQINILGGNVVNADGRVFITAIIRVSTDGGTTWTDLDGNGGAVLYDGKPYVDSLSNPQDANPFAIPNGSYFQSDPTLTVNRSDTNAWESTFMEITDDASAVLAAGVTHVNIDFYSVHHTDDTIEDPFFGVNPFTGIDDNITAAGTADFNGDSIVSLLDFNILALKYGTLAGATNADGDTDNDGDVDDDDYANFKAQFGNVGGGLRMSNPDEPWPIVSPLIWEIDIIEAVGAASVPEPASAALLGLAGAALLRRRM